MKGPLTPGQLESLRQLDTCAVANAVDTFDVRLRNEGFADASVRCMFPRQAPIVGYAVTVKIRCSSPPIDGQAYPDRTDWWNHILTLPAPRIVVLEDVDRHPGTGALLGEIHCHILMALGCAGAITNGAVRDLGAVEARRFQLFAGSVAVSHAYSHIVEIGGPVEIGGLEIKSGQLLHADRQGVLAVPKKIAAQIPAVAARMAERERKLVALCRSSEFTVEKLRAAVKEGLS
jgi:4-hydroxy-4-methyl-2-oxoglutarate aldolase